MPLAKLMLRCGVGCSEFVAVAKAVFVQVASEQYGVRGRPANDSRVAAITGLSRKQVRRIRNDGPVTRWTPDMKATPANTVLHCWHFDPKYSAEPGQPMPLPFQGNKSFTALVKESAGDIPAGAMLRALIRTGTVSEDALHNLTPHARYFYPDEFDEDFIQTAAFALKNLGNTLVHNAAIWAHTDLAGDPTTVTRTHFERSAWTDRLRPESTETFKAWVRTEGARFIEQADDWIGNNEIPKTSCPDMEPKSVGVGLYYFEEE